MRRTLRRFWRVYFTNNASLKDFLSVLGILIAAGIFFWIGYGLLMYFNIGAPNS